MSGYKGYSMSNNAIAAYNEGEKPKSKWTKTEIVREIEKSCKYIFSRWKLRTGKITTRSEFEKHGFRMPNYTGKYKQPEKK